jgi:hypothetical protein
MTQRCIGNGSEKLAIKGHIRGRKGGCACQRFIDEVLKPRFLPVIQPTQFNYPIDIHGKWRGTRYRFIQRYRSGFLETMNEEFDRPFAALDWVARGRFDIQWHRHTGVWHCLYRGLSLTGTRSYIPYEPSRLWD